MAATNPFLQFGYDDGGGPSPTTQPSDSSSSTPLIVTPSPTAAPPEPVNPFVKFGYDDGSGQAGSAAVPQTPHGGGALSNDPSGDSYTSGAAKGVATAAIKGAGDAVGFAGNLHKTLDYGENWIESKFTGETPEQVGARRQAAMDAAQERARNAGGLSGAISTAAQAARPGDISGSTISDAILARTGEYVPQTEAGRIGMAGVEAAVGSAGPGMGAAAPGIGGAALASGVLKAAPAMAASGAIGQGVGDVTGSPIAGMAAGLAVPAGIHAAGEGLRSGVAAAKSAIPPLTAAQREAHARSTVGGEMQAAVTDPQAATTNLATQPAEIIPGSRGTTAQIAGDPGLARYEKAIGNTPDGGAALATRATEQNNARQAALGSVQPDGNVLDLPAGLREQRDATDQATQAHVDSVNASTAASSQLADIVTQAKVTAAENAHQASVDALRNLKPDASPVDLTNHFRSVLDTLDAETGSKVDAANQAAAAARDATAPSGRSAVEVGQALRQPAADALAEAKQREGELWRAVDPTGKMVMPSGPIADAAKSIASGVTASATPMAGEEARIFDVASKYGDQMPFKEVTDLRSSLSTAMRQARVSGDAQSLRRLTMLGGSVEGAIDHAVENQAAMDQIAVRRGTMAPEDAMEARMRDWQSTFYAGKEGARTGTVEDFEGDAGGGSTSVSRVSRTEGQGNGGPRNPPGNQGASSAQPLDETAAGRLKAASTATRERHETFDTGAAGSILKEGRTKGDYAKSDAQVPAAVFKPGPTGAEAIRSYTNAGGSHDALFDAAAMSAHAASIRPDGTLDAPKLSQWMVKHREAINAMPDEVGDRFLTSLDAHQAVEDALADRRDQMSTFEKSEAGKAAKLSQPADIVKHVGAIIDGPAGSVQRMSEMASQTKGNAVAEQGLKRAVIEHVIDKFLPEVGDPRAEKLDAYLAAKNDVLSKALSPADIAKLKSGSADVQANSAAIDTAQGRRASEMRNVAAAGKARIDAAEAYRAKEQAPFKSGTIAQLLGVTSRDDVLNVLKGAMNAKDGAARMEALAKRVAHVDGGPDALKRGIQEVIQREVNSTTASGASEVMEQCRATFAKLMAEKRDALVAAGLSPQQMNKLDRIVKDGMQANRSISLARARGGSDTDANKQLRLDHAGNTSIINRIAHEAAGLGVSSATGFMVGGPLGGGLGAAAGWLGRNVVGHLREAGLNRVRELRIQAALDPEFGLELLRQAPKASNRNASVYLGLRARQLAVLQASSQGRQQRDVRA